MVSPELESANIWIERLHKGEIVGTLLVAVGVAIEFACSWFGKPLQNKIDTARAIEIAQLNRDTAEAHKEAEHARKQAESFESEIAKANERAAEAMKEAARLNKLAEEEKLARIKIEQRFADRQLTDKQVEVVLNKIKKFTNQEYEVTTFWDLKEPVAFANRIHSILTAASWMYVKPKNAGFLLGGIAGIQVFVHPEADKQAQEAAKTLVESLNEQDIDSQLKYINDPGHPTNKISLNIGTKH